MGTVPGGGAGEADVRRIVGLSAGWFRSWYRPSNIVPLCSRRPLKDIVKCYLKVRMNSAEFHILRRNEDLYASKRETYFFVGRARLKSSCSSVLSLFHVATTCESDASR